MLKRGFPPIGDAETRIFILGSLPGDKSIGANQYYAHHGNQFWKLVGSAAACQLQSLDYEARLAVLAERGIGLWDVMGAAHREGSLDSAIIKPTHNSLGGLREDYPKLEAIGFNGGRASKDGRKLLAGVEGLKLYDLISSSGAAARPFREKAAIWQIIAQHLK